MGFQDTFKALSDPTRREILSQLRQGSLSAGDIAAKFQLSNATVSHHLSILKGAGLILDVKQGKYIFYELNTSVLEDILAWITDLKGEKEDEKQ